MRKRSRRLDQVELEVERPEERRCGGERVDRRADVVAEARERELGGAGPTADGVARLEDANGAPGLGEGDCSGKAVGPRADDDGVEVPTTPRRRLRRRLSMRALCAGMRLC
jgi:hypothetical protein